MAGELTRVHDLLREWPVPAEKFGEEPWPGRAADEPDPDTVEARRLRPSPDGGSGPH